MREIVLDTETTGLDPASGHRVVEIGGVELFNCVPTGQFFHQYIHPERDMPDEAFAVHGLTAEFLAQHPVFAAVVDAFVDFIGDAPLVIHNAEFDLRFLNAEFKLVSRPLLTMERVVDTLAIARRKHPGAANSLDALCARYRIDASRRVRHGALLDAEILADVYAELTGGRQSALILVHELVEQRAGSHGGPRVRPVPMPSLIEAAEAEAHAAFVASLGEKAFWHAYDQRV